MTVVFWPVNDGGGGGIRLERCVSRNGQRHGKNSLRVVSSAESQPYVRQSLRTQWSRVRTFFFFLKTVRVREARVKQRCSDRFLPTTGPRNQFTAAHLLYFIIFWRRCPRAAHTHTRTLTRLYLCTRRYSLWWPSPPAAAAATATRPFRYRLYMGGLNYSINGPTSKGRGYTLVQCVCVCERAKINNI